MMRYVILLAMLLCLPVRGEAWQVVGAGSSSGPVYTDCSAFPAGASFYYTADHASGTTYACKSSSTTVTLTVNGTVVAGASDPGTASPESVGNVLKNSAAWSDAFVAPITSVDIIDTDEGRITLDVYIQASGDNSIFYWFFPYDSKYLSANIRPSGAVKIIRSIGGSSTSVQSVATIPTATWTRVEIRWSVTNNKVGVKIGAGSWEYNEEGTVIASGASPTSFEFGGGFASGAKYFDNISFYKASGL